MQNYRTGQISSRSAELFFCLARSDSTRRTFPVDSFAFRGLRTIGLFETELTFGHWRIYKSGNDPV